MEKEEPNQVQLNLRVKDDDPFYSNEVTLNFNPTEIILDFKCLAPLHDVGDHRSLLLKHLPVLLNPFHAKSFLMMLDKVIKDYENKFGEIKKPEAIKKAEKIVHKEQDKIRHAEPKKETSAAYFG